ncbi:MAG: helix-turn-helix transcriptional regulator [Ruminococcus sp.]|nr:helix-turn-helix transcriptional regulator [Ruminococcus sp.]
MNIVTANRLLQYRKLHNLSQEELAEKIGVSRQAVSKWERAEASPDTDNLILLAQVYGVTLDELLQGEEEPAVKEEKSETHEPDENTNYVKKDRVSFKHGIHVDSKNGDNVDISFRNGIHVDSKDGSSVHIDKHGVNVFDGEKVRAYTDEDGNVMVDEELEKHKKNKKIANMVPVWAIALGAFLAWGFSGVLCGWALSWICFLAIPLYHTLVDAIFERNAAHFAYPVLCVVFQMITGFLFNGWAWGWIAYLTIPVYYVIVNIIREKG